MSDPGLKYRLDQSVGFLEAAMSRQLAAQSASVRWPKFGSATATTLPRQA